MVRAAERIESRTPSAKFGGVDSDLPRRIGSPAANTTVSVHVPPTSVATMYLRLASDIDDPRRLGGRGQRRDAQEGCAIGERVRPCRRWCMGDLARVIGGVPFLAARDEQQINTTLQDVSKHRQRGWPLGVLELAFCGNRQDGAPHARLAQLPERPTAVLGVLMQLTPDVPERVVRLH